MRPHVLGIDDAPFVKGHGREVPVVGVMMEGAQLVEGVAVTSFPVDGPGATGFLVSWINGMSWHDSLQAIVLGGITIAGLGMVDIVELAAGTGIPVLSATRKNPWDNTLERALRAAGFEDRLAILRRPPPAVKLAQGLYLASAGTDQRHAEAVAGATMRRASLPEPLRIAHLIGAALVNGQSRGRV